MGIVPSAWAPCTTSGQRLALLAGVSPEQLPFTFSLQNVYPGAAETADRETLRVHGAAFVFDPEHRYVLAGYEVCRALGERVLPSDGTRDDLEPLRWYESREGIRVALLPHPSGRNRWYNSASNRRAAEVFLRRCRRDDERARANVA